MEKMRYLGINLKELGGKKKRQNSVKKQKRGRRTQVNEFFKNNGEESRETTFFLPF